MPDDTQHTKPQRRLAAILAADIAGYSALMGSDEARTVRDLKAHQAIILPMVGDHGGRIIDTAGDGILAEFGSVVNAVECAVAIQKAMAERNTNISPDRQMRFRIGINLGDVIHDESRVYGDGVNIAARLESIAEPGGICISAKVYDEIRSRITIPCHDLGLQQLKNIAEPVRVFRMELGRTPLMPRPAEATKSLALRFQNLFLQLVRRPPASASSRTSVVVGFVVASGLAVAATSYTRNRAPVPPVAPATSTAISPARKLDIDTVPFISDFSRRSLRETYAGGATYKAFAISFVGLGIATGKESEAAAAKQALDLCRRGNANSICELYAVGESVISSRAEPPLPPHPWVPARTSSLQTFEAAHLPFADEKTRNAVNNDFGKGKGPKALAISPLGKFSYFWEQGSIEEAVRRTLEMCGDQYGLACQIIAVDGAFVRPIPERFLATGFFRPDLDERIAPSARAVLKQKFDDRHEWSAVAAGAAGLAGFANKQLSESSGATEALRLCGEVDRDCRIIAIGDFSVVPR